MSTPEEDKERADIIATHAITHSEHWASTVGAMADFGFGETIRISLDPDADEKKRCVAIGEGRVWAILRSLPETSRQAYEQMVASEQPKPDETEDVGSTLEEQWHQSGL